MYPRCTYHWRLAPLPAHCACHACLARNRPDLDHHSRIGIATRPTTPSVDRSTRELPRGQSISQPVVDTSARDLAPFLAPDHFLGSRRTASMAAGVGGQREPLGHGSTEALGIGYIRLSRRKTLSTHLAIRIWGGALEWEQPLRRGACPGFVPSVATQAL